MERQNKPVTTIEYIFRLIRGVFIITGTLCCAGVAASFFGRFHLIFELSCHLYIQYFIFTSIAAAILTFEREWKKASLMALFAIYCATALAPFISFKAANAANEAEGAAKTKILRAACANILTANGEHQKIIDMAVKYDPDFIILIEVNKKWAEAMKALEKDYPYVVLEPSEDNFGMAFYSRIKPVTAEIILAGALPVPFLKAKFAAGEKEFTLYAAHPLPPLGNNYLKLRNGQLESMAAIIAREGGRALLMGDLNVTPWSPYFKDFKTAAGLENSSEGRGLNASWPAQMPAPLRIPIDYCMNSKDVKVVKVFTGQFNGSDHFPVIADFTVE